MKKENKKTKKPASGNTKKKKPVFKKTPKAVLFIMMVLALAMLALMLLFQMGLLFDWGLTALTSDTVVMAITISLIAFGLLSLIGIVRSFTTDYANMKRGEELITSYERIEGRADDREYQATNGAAMPVNVRDTKSEPVADDVEQNPAPAEEAAQVADIPSDQEIEAQVPDNAQNEPENFDTPIDAAAEDQEPQAYAETQYDQNVDQGQNYASDNAGDGELADEATGEEPAQPLSAEEQERENRVAVFEKKIYDALQKAKIPETLFVIEAYRENAICLYHDDRGYLIFLCKNNDAEDPELYSFDQEHEVMTRFFERIAPLIQTPSAKV